MSAPDFSKIKDEDRAAILHHLQQAQAIASRYLWDALGPWEGPPPLTLNGALEGIIEMITPEPPAEPATPDPENLPRLEGKLELFL